MADGIFKLMKNKTFEGLALRRTQINYPYLLLIFIFQDEIGLKEWSISLRSAHKMSLELLSNMAKKAGKIYGTDGNNKPSLLARNVNGN